MIRYLSSTFLYFFNSFFREAGLLLSIHSPPDTFFTFASLRPSFQIPRHHNKKEHQSVWIGVLFWRRRRDLNPRYPFGVYTISNRARSASYATSPYHFQFVSRSRLAYNTSYFAICQALFNIFLIQANIPISSNLNSSFYSCNIPRKIIYEPILKAQKHPPKYELPIKVVHLLFSLAYLHPKHTPLPNTAAYTMRKHGHHAYQNKQQLLLMPSAHHVLYFAFPPPPSYQSATLIQRDNHDSPHWSLEDAPIPYIPLYSCLLILCSCNEQAYFFP